MLHSEGISALTKLSDSVKSGLLFSVSMTEQIIAAHKKHDGVYDEIRRLGELAQKDSADTENILERIKVETQKIPPSEELLPMELIFH